MITIETIKSEQTKLAEMIARFETQLQSKRIITIPGIKIELQDGEHYAGIILGKDGEPDHHLILLPGEAENVNWEDAQKFAAKAGGEYRAMLPTRREQALLYANLKEQFTDNYYWSGEQHAAYSGYAWCQYFDYGYQGYYDKIYERRCRFVRLIPLNPSIL